MCGIFFSVSSGAPVKPDASVLENLKARGPDSIEEHVVELKTSKAGSDEIEPLFLVFVSTVLALRGDRIRIQPLVDPDSGSVLCWNGEAWKFDESIIAGNDSIKIFELLLAASNSPQPQVQILNVLTNIAGPFAFVYYDAISSNLYYGRDRLGRRSLMESRGIHSSLIVSSNSTNAIYQSCVEIDTSMIHALGFEDKTLEPQKLPWLDKLPSLNLTLIMDAQIPPKPTRDAVKGLQSQLSEAIRIRVIDVPSLSHKHTRHSDAKIAVLFSGGLDCTLLARFAHDLLPLDEPIDLLNVSFENPRILKAASLPEGSSPYEGCPDRITGRLSYEELLMQCPSRKWNFVAINISFQESNLHRPAIIALMHPHSTDMDLSIAMALYFAARGRGLIDSGAMYTTPARVLLSGLGADELFAGYTRHATAFTRRGFQGLVEELDLDFRRIGSRNLGRDDRVISQWGREIRYPYLDECLLAFVLNLPVWEKCGFRSKSKALDRSPALAEDIDPAKLLLRMLAKELNMPRVAGEKKRAIQFGARTARMEISILGQGRRKGTDSIVLLHQQEIASERHD